MERRPDIIASIRLYPTEKGGRKGPTPGDIFRCPLQFEDKKFDCALFLEEAGPLIPGASAMVPIMFLFPDLIKPRLKVGSKFTLWDLGEIGSGVVEEIIA
jgi:hypothetical protein